MPLSPDIFGWLSIVSIWIQIPELTATIGKSSRKIARLEHVSFGLVEIRKSSLIASSDWYKIRDKRVEMVSTLKIVVSVLQKEIPCNLPMYGESNTRPLPPS